MWSWGGSWLARRPAVKQAAACRSLGAPAAEAAYPVLHLVVQVAPRELVDWCAERLAHYKVPAAIHVLPKMPTTGSGKILKTELRRMFGGGGAAGTSSAAGAAAAAPAGTAAVDAAAFAPDAADGAAAHATAPAPLAEMAAALAAVAGGGLACQPLDAGLGAEWGRELLPALGYLLAVQRAADIQSQVGSWSLASFTACSRPNVFLEPCNLLSAPRPARF